MPKNELKTFTEVTQDAEGRDEARTLAKRIDLSEYENNKDIRITETKDFEQLESDLKKYGDLGPLLVNSGKYWGKPGAILGGNTRIRVYTKHKVDKIWVKVVDPKNEAEFVELAIIHNGQYSQWNPDGLAQLTSRIGASPALLGSHVQLAHGVSIKSLQSSYGPPETNNTGGTQTSQDKPKDLDPTAYQNATIKQIVLYYDAAEYAALIPRLDRITKEHKIESYSDLLLILVAFYESEINK